MPKRKIAKIITAVTGDQIIVGELELRHAQEHFLLPDMILLELLELVLKDPTEILVDDLKAPRLYQLFYRLENKRFLCAVVKITTAGCFFASMCPTGTLIRNPHKKLKRLKL
ncbi:MAG: hypothetical protein NTV34_11260 [Proteobacteria bacterium]|nr:hypothetical protein [Pseudomonadota bacterium]